MTTDRKIFLLYILFAFTNSVILANEKYRLTIYPIDTRTQVNCWDKIDGLKLRSYCDSIYEHELIPEENDFLYQFQVPNGEYFLEYKNYFGQIITKKILIYGRDKKITINPDSLIAYTRDFLTELKNSDSIIIWTEMQSCKTSEDAVTSITRINDNYFYNYHSYLTFFVDSTDNYPSLNGLSHIINGTKKSILLKAKSKELINRFLNEFLVVKNGGSWTKHDLYLIRINGIWIELVDSRNRWNGYDKLVID